MKNKLILTLISAALLATVFVSCKDDFTEEDALNAQQTISYNVVVLDAATKIGVEGAEVKVVIDGIEQVATTNTLGTATFKNVKIGNDFPVAINKEGFTSVNTTAETSYVEYRQAEVSSIVYVMSLTTNLATVSGKVEIETDVTNETREKITSGTVKAIFEPGNYNGIYLSSNFSIEATISAEGTYELKLPTFGTGVEYTIIANDIEVDQKIAYNKKPGEPDFPATLPKAENIKTVFSHNGGAVSIPSFVPAVFATMSVAPTGASAAVARLYVETDPDGKIDYIGVNNMGYGYAASTTVPVVISSLLGGSGATANANTDALGRVTSVSIVNAGTGYPDENYNTPDATYNSSVSASNLYTSNFFVKSGDIKVRNIYYGTGSSRAIEIQ
ncbi:MAG TPA: hypothetical protein DIS90_09170 [Cytophagales bacterium]|nr:hypothetical protein [Cytophagales bacterium]HCR53900.1 hypothetical protein [Cytophagales bacterium]